MVKHNSPLMIAPIMTPAAEQRRQMRADRLAKKVQEKRAFKAELKRSPTPR